MREREIISSIRAATHNMCLYYQQHVKPSSSQWHEYEGVIRDNKEKKKKEERLIVSLENEWDNNAGPFVRLLDSTITSLKVKRQRYHGGTFVGNDCIRLLNGRDTYSHLICFIPRMARRL